jgi:hypothetical protein
VPIISVIFSVISSLTERLSASQRVPWSMELVNRGHDRFGSTGRITWHF